MQVFVVVLGAKVRISEIVLNCTVVSDLRWCISVSTPKCVEWKDSLAQCAGWYYVLMCSLGIDYISKGAARKCVEWKDSLALCASWYYVLMCSLGIDYISRGAAQKCVEWKDSLAQRPGHDARVGIMYLCAESRV